MLFQTTNLSSPVPITLTANGVYTEPNGFGYSPVTVNVSGGGLLYTNSKIYSSDEKIDDVSNYTFLYDESIPYGYNGTRVAERLAITDEQSHTDVQTQYITNLQSYYESENKIGACAGYNFGQIIDISKAKVWLNRYAGQNKTLIATLQYLDGDGNWHDISDMKITETISYPSYIFEVPIHQSCYGIRWIHKKEPYKSYNNNISFSGMTIYRGLGQYTNVYIPQNTGLNTVPSGYNGFGPIYIYT